MFNRVRRMIIDAICIVVFYILQTTICNWILPYTATPNLLLILTMSIGLLRGRIEGMFVGLFSGLILDVFSGDMIGFYAVIYMYIGFLNGILKKSFVSDLPLFPMFICGISEIMYHIYIFVFNFLIRNRLNFIAYWHGVIMPEIVVTILANILVYWFILGGNNMLERKEKEGATKFVL